MPDIRFDPADIDPAAGDGAAWPGGCHRDPAAVPQAGRRRRREKGPGDLVTVADEAAERALGPALAALVPGSLVVGEEAAAADPAVLDRLSGTAPVWVIDPIDGTRNFAAGDPRFVTMVALVAAGATLAGWIHDPLGGRTAVARAGQGARLDGRPLRRPPQHRPMREWRGHFNGGQGGSVRHRRAKAIRSRVAARQPITSAGASYLELAEGNVDFALFQRLLPWDHLAGALIAAEAGAKVALLPGGAPYDVGSRTGPILAAADGGTWEDVADVWRQVADDGG